MTASTPVARRSPTSPTEDGDAPGYDVVIPTVGRPSVGRLIDALRTDDGPGPQQVIVVDDRRDPAEDLDAAATVVAGPARGPAAARNVGWRQASAPWVVFLDDDVVTGPGWKDALAADLATTAGGSQGRLVVPLPRDRRPTDWERNVAGLEQARWATADMAYRRDVLVEVGGFDERLPRAYREDADLALRVLDAGYELVRGRRVSTHPVRPGGRWVSVSLQTGNADDAMMARRHGRRWRERAGAPRGRRPWHVATAVAAAVAILGRSRLAALTWLGLTADLAWRRISPGPRTPAEVATMVATSIALPPVATYHWIVGVLRAARTAPPS